MKPAARFLLIGLASVVLLTFIAGVGVVWQTRKLTQSRMLEHLQAASAVESELQADRLRELQIHGDALASDPAFVDYIAQSLIPNPKLGGGVDSQSIDDLLSERRRGYDIAVVLDATGKPVGHSGTLLKDDASIRKEAFVANCIEMRKPTHGLWADHGQLILVAANPMLKGGVLQGVVLTATHLDADFATAIQRLTRTGIVLFVPAPTASGTSASNGLASWIAPALVAEAQQMIVATTTSGAALKLSDGQHDMAAWATPLDADGGHAVLVALDSGANGD
ncbi:MAG: hypothetical protein ABIT64_00385, partial [Lysobacteraceae bacterium]